MSALVELAERRSRRPRHGFIHLVRREGDFMTLGAGLLFLFGLWRGYHGARSLYRSHARLSKTLR